jgi:hypothetical protein
MQEYPHFRDFDSVEPGTISLPLGPRYPGDSSIPLTEICQRDTYNSAANANIDIASADRNTYTHSDAEAPNSATANAHHAAHIYIAGFGRTASVL